jgi:hypothetical protein
VNLFPQVSNIVTLRNAPQYFTAGFWRRMIPLIDLEGARFSLLIDNSQLWLFGSQHFRLVAHLPKFAIVHFVFYDSLSPPGSHRALPAMISPSLSVYVQDQPVAASPGANAPDSADFRGKTGPARSWRAQESRCEHLKPPSPFAVSGSCSGLHSAVACSRRLRFGAAALPTHGRALGHLAKSESLPRRQNLLRTRLFCEFEWRRFEVGVWSC